MEIFGGFADNFGMRPIPVKQLDYDLTPTAGLALVGHFLNTIAPVLTRIDAALPVRTGVANSDIVRSYLGLLVQGKSDFDAIENVRADRFFREALGIAQTPSSPTLRPGKRVALRETEASIEGIARPVRRVLIEHGRQLILGLGANDRCAEVFIRMNAHLGSSGTGVT